MFKIIVSPKSQKELKQLKKSHKLAINLIFEELKENPTIGKPLTRELTGRYSYRAGVHRIIYIVNQKDKIIYIITTGHRNTVYK